MKSTCPIPGRPVSPLMAHPSSSQSEAARALPPFVRSCLRAFVPSAPCLPLLIYGLLIAGALIFAFPFVWMVATSFKLDREMATDRMRLLPAAPRPRDASPYMDAETFPRSARPDGLPPAVWAAAQPRLQGLIAARVADWSPRTEAVDAVLDRALFDEDAYAATMGRGLLAVVVERLTDRAREAARAAAAAGQAGAIERAIGAIAADAARILDEATLREVFDRSFRRFCLGDCRVRSDDYRMHTLSAGGQWEVASGPAELLARVGPAGVFQAARLRFARGADTAVFRLAVDPPVDPGRIDRVHVTCRSDATWARVRFEVLRGGRCHGSTEVTNLAGRDWVETQLRWPDGAGDPMARRMYQVLADAGASGTPEPLVVRVVVTRNSRLCAWWDKALYAYRAVFRELPFGRYIATSLALSLLSILLMVFSCTLTAYAFARLHWPGRDMCFGIMLATMMIPPQVTMIPAFLIHRQLGWYNTLLPLWAPAAFGSAFFIFLLRQFLKTIPMDLEDAARIDGCGFLRIYWHVMLPLVSPTIAIIAIYTFMGTWNNFMGPLIYVNDERLFPLALGLFKFNLRSGGDVGLMMAASLVMTLPVIGLFFFVQRYFIQGITLTGMKG